MCDKCEIKEMMGGNLIALSLSTVVKLDNCMMIKSFEMIESEVNDVLAEIWTTIEPTAREAGQLDFAEEKLISLAIYLYSGYQGAMLNNYSKTGNPSMWETADALGERGFKLSVA